MIVWRLNTFSLFFTATDIVVTVTHKAATLKDLFVSCSNQLWV